MSFRTTSGAETEVKLRHVVRHGAAVAIASLIAVALGPSPTVAASIAGQVGYEMSRGPGGQQTEAALGVVSLDAGVSDALLGVIRFDDRQVGTGFGLVLGGGIGLAPTTRLRVLGTRFFGDGDYRALRLKVGPQWTAGRASIGLFYTHDTSNLAPDAHGATTEFGFPLAPRLGGKLGASFADAEGASGVAGSMGLSWTLVPHLEVSGELGLARNLAAAGATGPPSWGALDPVLGGAEEPRPSDEFSPTALLSARVTFP